MKLHSLFSIGLVAALGIHCAYAQEGKSRAQARAELQEAIRAGDLSGPGELALPMNVARPDLYPARRHDPGKSREQVKSELADAIRTGDIMANGESAARLNELYPHRYPPVASAQGKSRDQVRSELAQAISSGDVLGGGESSLKLNELYPWSYRNGGAALAPQSPAHNDWRGTLSRSN